MFTALKALVFVLSSLGLGLELKRRAELDVCLVPITVIAVQLVVLFFGALLNTLMFAGVLLLALGLVCLVRALLELKFPRVFDWKTALLFVAALFMLAVVTLAVRGHSFLHYDNYTHWAIFVKLLLGADSLPSNLSPVLISHHSYVPGSALYIWFVSRFIARPESMQMLAQAYMTLAALLSLFAYATRNTASAGLFCMLSYIALTFVVRVQDLLVDALLPAVGVAAIAFAWLRLSSTETNKLVGPDAHDAHDAHVAHDANDAHDVHSIFRWRLVLAEALLCLPLLVKNAGILYAIPALALTLRAAYKQLSTKELIAAALFPVACRILWDRHDLYAFTTRGTHAVSLDYYRGMLSDRSASDVQSIVSTFFSELLARPFIWITLALLLTLGILMFIYLQEQRKRVARDWLAITAFIVLYAVGLLLMYCIDMSTEEALRMSGFERYWRSLLLGALLLATVCALRVSASTKSSLTWTLVAALAFAPLTIFKSHTLFANERIPRFRAHMEELLNQHDELWRHTIYVLQASDDEKTYNSLMIRYVMESRYSYVADNLTGDGQYPAENFDYVILFDEEKRDEFDAWVAENYPEQLGEDIICTLSADELEEN